MTSPAASSRDLSFDTASWARRVAALFVDWIASTLVLAVFLGPQVIPFVPLLTGIDPDPDDTVWVLGVYVLESALFTATVGGSFGKVATRLRTVRADGDVRPIPLPKAFARQMLIALLVPPLVFRPDGRGLHDLATGSATVTLPTYLRLAGKA